MSAKDEYKPKIDALTKAMKQNQVLAKARIEQQNKELKNVVK
jgi:hypothetical protein